MSRLSDVAQASSLHPGRLEVCATTQLEREFE